MAVRLLGEFELMCTLYMVLLHLCIIPTFFCHCLHPACFILLVLCIWRKEISREKWILFSLTAVLYVWVRGRL